MNIEWEVQMFGDKMKTLAKIPVPSKISPITAALYQQGDSGLWSTAFLPAIREHFDIPTQGLRTELGARRRIRKYLELWAIAGYPARSK